MFKSEPPRDLLDLLKPLNTSDVASCWSQLQATTRQPTSGVEDMKSPSQYLPSCGCHKWEARTTEPVVCSSAAADVHVAALLGSALLHIHVDIHPGS